MSTTASMITYFNTYGCTHWPPWKHGVSGDNTLPPAEEDGSPREQRGPQFNLSPAGWSSVGRPRGGRAGYGKVAVAVDEEVELAEQRKRWKSAQPKDRGRGGGRGGGGGGGGGSASAGGDTTPPPVVRRSTT